MEGGRLPGLPAGSGGVLQVWGQHRRRRVKGGWLVRTEAEWGCVNCTHAATKQNACIRTVARQQAAAWRAARAQGGRQAAAAHLSTAAIQSGRSITPARTSDLV